MNIEAIAGTPNWIAARRGCLTASRVRDALAVLKSGKPSESRQKLAFDLVAERVTGIAVSTFVTADMQWGIDQQAPATVAYEDATGHIVGPEAFVLHPSIDWFGATPDGTIGNDGLVEFKCPRSSTHIAYKLAGTVPDQYRPQMLAQLACTRRKWCDFVSFDPRIAGKARLFVVRFEPSADEIESLENEVQKFLAEVAAMVEQLENV